MSTGPGVFLWPMLCWVWECVRMERRQYSLWDTVCWALYLESPLSSFPAWMEYLPLLSSKATAWLSLYFALAAQYLPMGLSLLFLIPPPCYPRSDLFTSAIKWCSWPVFETRAFPAYEQNNDQTSFSFTSSPSLPTPAPPMLWPPIPSTGSHPGVKLVSQLIHPTKLNSPGPVLLADSAHTAQCLAPRKCSIKRANSFHLPSCSLVTFSILPYLLIMTVHAPGS